MKLAMIGATGLVGRTVLRVLEENRYLELQEIDTMILAASPNSIGKTLKFNGKDFPIHTIETALKLRPDYAIFSAGASVSLEWAHAFTSAGITVVDNSSAWRMHSDVPLIVPEVNIHDAKQNNLLISNPNCTTIQVVMVAAVLHRQYRISRMVISTYQAVTGSGMAGVNQLKAERENRFDGVDMAYPHPIDLNIIPQGGVFLDDGYTTEEIKLVNETRKILGDESISITATVARVPVFGGHSASVNIEFQTDFNERDIKELLKESPGICLLDNPRTYTYPTPLIAEGKDEVFVGRIRRDYSRPNSLNLWIVADNLRKGAATNAVQIIAAIESRKSH